MGPPDRVVRGVVFCPEAQGNLPFEAVRCPRSSITGAPDPVWVRRALGFEVAGPRLEGSPAVNIHILFWRGTLCVLPSQRWSG